MRKYARYLRKHFTLIMLITMFIKYYVVEVEVLFEGIVR